MGRIMNCTIFVINGPCIAGLASHGEGVPSFSIAGPTGEGVTTPLTFSAASVGRPRSAACGFFENGSELPCSGSVLGTATATIKHSTLEGERMLVVQLLDAQSKPDGEPIIVFDRLGAGRGDSVLCTNVRPRHAGIAGPDYARPMERVALARSLNQPGWRLPFLPL